MNAFDKFVEELMNKEYNRSSEIPKHSGNKNINKNQEEQEWKNESSRHNQNYYNNNICLPCLLPPLLPVRCKNKKKNSLVTCGPCCSNKIQRAKLERLEQRFPCCLGVEIANRKGRL